MLLSEPDSASRPAGGGRIQPGSASSTVRRSQRNEPDSETSLFLVSPAEGKPRGREPCFAECDRAAAFGYSGALNVAIRCRREESDLSGHLHRPPAT